MFLTLIFLVAVFIAIELLRPKPKLENARPAGLGDFRFPTATQGRVVPLLWGTVLIEGPNVVWYGDLQQRAISKKVKTGMFSSTRVITGFHYHVGIQFALCRGPIDYVKRLIIGDCEVFDGAAAHGDVIAIDKPQLFGGDDLGQGGIVGSVRVHAGTASQVANSYLSAFQAVNGVTSRYRDICYLVFENGYIGNSSQIDPWKFELRRVTNCNPLGLPDPSVNTSDANPMNVVCEIFTDDDWGFKYDMADIDTVGWGVAAATLKAEGNGFSLLTDSPINGEELVKEIERQIDGFFYLDQATGLWKIKLARDDYNIDTVPQLVDPVEVEDFSRGSWEETTNQVRVQFNNRVINYGEAFGLAQDLANAMIQGGGTTTTGRNISVTESYPGVKNSALANQLAWRDLRVLSYPLAKATFVVDRSFWNVTPFSVIAWTDARRGFVKLPMRIHRVDHGSLLDRKMRIDCVQDVFQFGEGSYAPPPNTRWTEPDDDLDPFINQKAFEAPRAFVVRDPDYTVLQDKIWATARAGGAEVSFKMRMRHAVGAPGGVFLDVGEVFAFARIGDLKVDLNAGSVTPLASFLITPTPDTQTVLETAFVDNPDVTDQGINLIQMIMIDDEFMLVQAAAVSGADVSLTNVYRGVLDSVQAKHLAGADVWLIFLGGGLIDSTLPGTNQADVKLLPRSLSDEVLEADATTISFTMDNRIRRPYPPSSLSLNGSAWATTTSLDAVAGGPELTGVDLDFIRRDLRTVNEIQALTVDAASIFGDFPAVHSTTHEVEVRNDPAGANTLLFTETGIAGTSKDILRARILRHTNGVVPTTMRLVLKSRHNYETLTALASRQSLTWDFATTSSLSALHNFGARLPTVASTLYNATVAGTYAFTLSSAFTVGAVESRVNGGGWTSLIAIGLTTGSILGVAISDTIEVRHQSTDPGAIKQLDMNAPGAGLDAYGILYV